MGKDRDYYSRGARRRSRSKERESVSKYRTKRSGRSRSRERRRSRTRSASPVDDRKKGRYETGGGRGARQKEKQELDLAEIVNMTDKEQAEKKLQNEMEKRKERIEKWRAERKKQVQLAAVIKDQQDNAGSCDEDEDASTNKKKMWTLDDDEDETDGIVENVSNFVKEEPMDGMKNEVKENVENDEEEEDPFDAYMREISKELRGTKTQMKQDGKSRVVVVKRARVVEPVKGDIMETEEDRQVVHDDFDLEQAAATATLLAKGRQLAQTDHSRVYYRPFRKDFYVEVPELARMTEEQVTEYREKLESIRVRGKNPPKPIKTWAQCGLEWRVLEVLKKNNYLKPTPIQAQGIPAVMNGRDVIGIAKTGSGKTLAFLLPMLRHVMDQEELDELDGPIALILSPTRELAMQIWREANKFAKVMDMRAVCVYGGTNISQQIADLKRGAEIIVCTPGRLIDMLAANNGKVTNLRRVTYLVLDEADRMFDMGFEPQVTKIVNNIRPDRQTVLFSATFPRQMEALARKVLQKPIEIQVGGRSVVCKDITQNVVICEEHQKFLKLLELLGVYWEYGNVLVFVDKQEKADELVGDLMKHGYNCAPLHGGIDQTDRDSAISDFKNAKLKLLVATSVAARGLDVKKLILVVNYDCPNHYEDYVHRVGRTGRAGNKGYCFTFILPEGQEQMAGDVCKAFELSGQPIPDDIRVMWEEWKLKMETEGKTVKQGGGFSGHGFKFDEAEAEAEATKKKMTKLVHGIEAGADDDDDEIENQITSIMKSKTRVLDGKTKGKGGETGQNVDALERAKMLALKISEEKKLGAVSGSGERDPASITAEAVMRGHQAAPITVSAKSIAQQKAEELNEKLNYIPSELHPGVDAEHDVEYFEEDLEINDFPQQVRWRVCSRDCIGQVQEYADVGISVKGSYYPPNKEPKDDERKLYLFLEARNELALQRAKTEIIRIMKECFRQMSTQARTAGQQGRYKVV